MTSKTLIIIPARMKAARLPNKPLALIANKPMIVHVWEKVIEANAGDVVVACSEKEVAEAIEKVGGKAVLTDPKLPSGTDRIYAAWKALDPKENIYDIIVNVQGDLPTLEPSIISSAIKALISTPLADITTPVTKIEDKSELSTSSVVKVATGEFKEGIAKALYFSRNPIPHGAQDFYHHIGLYAFRPKALAKFVILPPSKLEKEEKLEQLRALEAGFSIYVACVNAKTPFGVDTPADLQKARDIIEKS